MRLLSINREDKVVIYDDFGIAGACRAYWLFKTFGHKNAYILNGGLIKWEAENLPVDTNEY